VSSTFGMSSLRRKPPTHTIPAPTTNSCCPCAGHHITPPLHTLEGDGEGDHPCTWRHGREKGKERRDRAGVVPGGVEAKFVPSGSRRFTDSLLIGGGRSTPSSCRRRPVHQGAGEIYVVITAAVATPRFTCAAAIFR
jgi:hypothetical protein